MKSTTFLTLLLLATAQTGFAQVSGGAGAYGGNSTYGSNNRNSPAQIERAKRNPVPAELDADNTATFIDAAVLMNVKADEYVAVFAVGHEATTLAEANSKMSSTLGEFKTYLQALGVKDDQTFVDFIAQNKLYGYRLEGNVAKESIVGFELKKTVAVHFKDKNLLDQLTVAASRAGIYDLVKVDYLVNNTAAIQERLMTEASRLIKQKAARYESLLGVKLAIPTQVVAEKPSIYYPTDQYNSYQAFEAETVRTPYDNNRYTIQNARKPRTTYFDPLSGDGFDLVINPVITEPVVQFTQYVKVRYQPVK